MANYVLNSKITYRVGTIEEVEALHEELLNDNRFQLTEFSYKTKEIKVKGEVVEEYQLVKAKKVFNNEKEPDSSTEVFYGTKKELVQKLQSSEEEVRF